MNPYHVLDLPVDATAEEIKSKYKSLAQQYHPDKGGDTEKFKEINLSYSVLSDPIRRKLYDETGIYKNELNPKDQALNDICARLAHFLWKMNVDVEDLIHLLKSDIQNEKNQLNQKIGTTQQTIANFKRAVNKIRRKKEGENILQNFIKLQVKQQEDLLNNLNNRIKLCDTMLEIVDEYEYGDILIEFLEIINSMQQQNQS
jgi:curved DNA-binding protein CbpA